MMINGTHLINRAWIRNRDIAGRYVAVHEQRESLTCHIADRVFPCICAYSSIVACLAGAYSCCVQRCRQQQVIIIHCCLDPDVNVSPDAFAAEHGGIRSCNILPTEGILSLVPVPTVNPPPPKKKSLREFGVGFGEFAAIQHCRFCHRRPNWFYEQNCATRNVHIG